MIRNFALFECNVKEENIEAFCSSVLERLVPVWKQFLGNSAVSIMFSDDHDEGALEFRLILAISYPDEAAMNSALESDARYKSNDINGEIVDEFLEGEIHHHVTQMNEYVA